MNALLHTPKKRADPLNELLAEQSSSHLTLRTMDEDQAKLFEQRIGSLCGSTSNYTLENAIALMNDFPIDVSDSNCFSFLHLVCCNGLDITDITLQIIRALVERGNNINIGGRRLLQIMEFSQLGHPFGLQLFLEMLM